MATLSEIRKQIRNGADTKLTDDTNELFFKNDNKHNVDSFLNFAELNSKNAIDFACDIIRKQIEQEIKTKQDISNASSRIITYIYEKLDRGQSKIIDNKFRDHLLTIGYDKEDSKETINYLQDSFDATLDLDELKSFYSIFNKPSWMFHPEIHLKKLLKCSLMPGFLDSFIDNNSLNYYDLLWQKLFRFLLGHRLPSDMINEPYLENRIQLSHLRRRILFEIEKDFYEENLRNKSICINQECFNSITVCCSRDKVDNLIDKKAHTYWQASSSEKCDFHWIVIDLKENIRLTSLSLSTIGSRNDELLRSINIEVKTGFPNKIETVIAKCEYTLTINNEYTLCSCFPTDNSFSYIKVVFKRANDRNFPGKTNDLVKIRSLKLIGKHETQKEIKTSVQDASLCWYFEMMSTMALMQSQLMPNLYSKILSMTKSTLANMPPLSLLFESTFLTPNVLDKADEFFKTFLRLPSANLEEKTEAILIYLSFNLARGHLKSILDSIYIILENYELNYEYLSLITKIEEASTMTLRKTAKEIPVKLIKLSENSSNDKELVDTELISNEENTEIILQPRVDNNNSTVNTSKSAFLVYNMLMQVDQSTTISRINLKIKSESNEPEGAIVILLFNKERPNLKDFEQFDDFDESKFKAYQENGKKDQKYEICYFNLSFQQTYIYLELPIFHLVKYVLVKFLNKKPNQSIKPLIVTQLKVAGCNHDQFELYEELKQIQSVPKISNEIPPERSTSMLVNAVLWFLCQLAEQNKNYTKINQNVLKFLLFQDFEISDLWKIYEKSIEIGRKIASKEASLTSTSTYYYNLRIPILILLYELVNCKEIKSIHNSSTHYYYNIFDNLCEIIDTPSTDLVSNSDRILKRITKEILKNSVLVFFPSERTRKDCFLKMIENNIECEPSSACDSNANLNVKTDFSFKRHSTQLLFEAFCNLFCLDKYILVKYLVNKSENLFENTLNCNEALNFIDKLIKFGFFLSDSAQQPNTSPDDKLIYALNDLLNSIQSNIFYCMKEQLINLKTSKQTDENSIESNIKKFVLDYANLVIDKGIHIINTATRSSKDNLKNYLTKIIYNFILWLSELFNQLDLNVCTSIVEILLKFHKLLSSTECYFDDEQSNNVEKVLKTWSFNSKTRSTLFDLNMDYSYPLATKFIIEFDSSSLLSMTNENNSELCIFSFTDSDDRVHAFSGKLGSSTWSEKMEIKSNSYITFNVHSNKDLKLNSSFHLKFTVSAYGFEELKNRIQIKELLVSLTCLFGKHLSRCYLDRFNLINFDKKSDSLTNSNKFKLERSASVNSSVHNESKTNPFFAYQQPSVLVNNLTTNSATSDTSYKFYSDYNSEYYRILFRAGPVNQSNENHLLEFLKNLTNLYNSNQIETQNNEPVLNFLKLYDKNFETLSQAATSAKNKLGGIAISELILKIFSCLIWHSPTIKYEHLEAKHDTIAQAYKAAESTRLFIIEQQQLLKSNQQESSQNLIELISEKIDYLLQLDRLPEELLNYEIIKSHYAADLESFENSNINNMHDNYTNAHCKISKQRTKVYHTQTSKCKTKNKFSLSSNSSFLNRLPKFDSFPVLNLVYEFIFDPKISNLDQIKQILNLKRENSNLIAINFNLAHEFLSNIIIKDAHDLVNILECVLTFLSNFFDKTPNLNRTQTKLGKFPPILQFSSNHFLQNLFGCGLDQETLVRNAYFKFVKLILNLNKLEFENASSQLVERLKLRLDCFTMSLLNIDWDLFDLKFLNEYNIVGYLLKSSFNSMPIKYFRSEKNLSNSQVLEELFKLSRETFNSNISQQNGTKIDIVRVNSNNSTETKVEEMTEIPDEESFDMKIFPKLYQNLFQTSTGSTKPFDTDTLLKCLSTEIKTFEQYEKFIVARYMFWKYFSKLRANFYCDECEVMLTENRYVCLECREHCLCFNCFSKSIINESELDSFSNTNTTKTKKPANNLYAESHKSSHRMLLLDHLCDKCGSLIIGKRIHCEECQDYDLCLMCYKRFENIDIETKSTHLKEHRTTVIQPVIIVAKPESILDIQVYLYLQSQMMFSIFMIKLSTLIANINYSGKTNSIDQANLICAKKMHSNCFKYILFMINCISGSKLNNLNHELIDNLKLFVTYNQENLIGLLSSAIKISNHIFDNSNLDLFELDMKNIFNELIESKPIQDETFINIYNLIYFILNVLITRETFMFDETVVSMLINVLKIVLLNSDPEKVDLIVKKLITNLQHEYSYLKLISEYEIDSETKLVEKYREEGSLILEILFNWIDQSIQSGEITYVTLYIDLMSNLNKNLKWKAKMLKLVDLIIDLINVEINTKLNSTKFTQIKLFNFIYAFNSAPVTTGIGQWIEFKNDNRGDACTGLNGLPKSSLDFKVGLLKSLFYDGSSNTFSMWALDPISRKLLNFKELKYNADFRKPNEHSLMKNETDLYLNKSLVSKLIKLFKTILGKYKPNENSMLEQHSLIDSDLPLKQKLQKYEIMHIERKREINKIFQQCLPIRNNLLVLALITFIKDYISKKISNEISSQDAKIMHDSDSESELEHQTSQNLSNTKLDEDELDDETLIDYEFLNWIAKLSFSNTNMNAYWKVTDLRCYLVSLLLREGFTEIHSDDVVDTKKQLTSTSSASNTTSNVTIQKVTKLNDLNDSTTTTSSNNLFKSELNYNITNEYQLTLDSKKSTTKDEQSVDDLKLNLNSLAVLGVCDASPLCFSMDEMSDQSTSLDNSLKTTEALNDLRTKRSLKLFEDCIEKLVKYEASPTSVPQWSNLDPSIKNKFLTKFETAPKPSWLNELTINMSKFINNQTALNKLNEINSSIKLSIASRSSNNLIQPIRSAIKLVANASIVLTARQLLILFINWSLKLQEKSNLNKKLTIMQINCETEFELLQLLDILYYTDNSINYRLFIRNLLSSLNDDQLANKNKILNRISLMACHFMLPEYKFLRKINWSTEDDTEKDSGKLKNKTNNEPIYEENINFSSTSSNYSNKQTLEIENGSNLTTKPNDIEKLSSTDSTLLVLFENNKTSSQPFQIKSKCKQFKFSMRNSLKKSHQRLNAKYNIKDDFETEKENTKMALATHSEFEDSESETESLDSVIENSKLAKLSGNKRKLASKTEDDDDLKEENGSHDEFNEDNKSDYQLSPKSKIKKKVKETKKSRLCFQVITKRREMNSNYDSANDDYELNENRYDNDDEEDDDDDEDEDTRDSAEDDDEFSDDNSAKKSNSISDDDTTVENEMSNYGDSDEEKYKKLTYKLNLDSIEYIPYLAINNQKLLKWKFLRRDESDWTYESCSFKIYSSVSKNFHSAYYLLDELIDQLNINSFLQLNELWSYLIRISCAQVFNKRLKVLNLLIKIMHKVDECNLDKMCINLFALKPLKNLEYTLEMTSKEDRNLSRALFEMFFFAEKLAIKWQMQNEYRAQMKDKIELIEKVCETAYFINLILTSLNLNTNSNVNASPLVEDKKDQVETKEEHHEEQSENDTHNDEDEDDEEENDDANHDSDEDNGEEDDDDDSKLSNEDSSYS